MKITAIRRQRRHPDRVNIHVDGAFRIAVGAEVAGSAGLRVGQEVDESTLDELAGRNMGFRAREIALRYLAQRPRTEHELRQRLRRAEIPPAAEDDCIERLRDLGFVDDIGFARAFVAERLRSRPSGRIRLLNDLRLKGVAADDAERSVDELLGEGSDAELDAGRRAARKFKPRKGEEERRRLRRFHAYLARRGFAGETISRIADELYRSG